MKIERFEDLEVWKDARELCKVIFEHTNIEIFKKDYKFCSQIRSSSGSIMDNIAEGFERGGNKEFIQFLYISKGSCGETRSQIHRALDYNYISKDIYNRLIERTIALSKKISSLITYLKNSELKGSKHH
jgi:four helix bundle protein